MLHNYTRGKSMKAAESEGLQTLDNQVSSNSNGIGIMTLAPYDYRAVDSIGRKTFDPSISTKVEKLQN